uniref:Kinesin motor domain-containing protein n=1 Tax=Heterorhabditis bacteriophora TaxID=37862 RepID=A0A1I7X1P4_HETBA
MQRYETEGMCMAFICVIHDQRSKYKLIILNNRDEMLERPTLELGWRGNILSGVRARTTFLGIYVLGNSEASTPFKKVSYGQKLFEEVITNLDENTTVTEIIGKLLDIGSDRMVCFPDPQVRLQCGDNGDNLYRYLCSIMVQFPNSVRYGTRSHSIFIVDRNDNATFYEKSMYEIPEDVENAKWVEKTFHFKLK